MYRVIPILDVVIDVLYHIQILLLWYSQLKPSGFFFQTTKHVGILTRQVEYIGSNP